MQKYLSRMKIIPMQEFMIKQETQETVLITIPFVLIKLLRLPLVKLPEAIKVIK